MASALPSLHNLCIGRDTGVAIRLTAHVPKIAADALDHEDKKQKVPVVAGEAVANFTSADKAFTSLSDLVCELITPESEFVHRWREAMGINMNEKRSAYHVQAMEVANDSLKEHQKQIEIFVNALRSLPTADYTDPNHPERPLKTALAKDKAEVWDIVDTERWKALQDQMGEIELLQGHISDRIEMINDDARWKQAVVRFTNALLKITSYRAEGEMIEKIVDVIRAFVKNPKVGNSQFNNVVIMGDPGTGKTRLAGIIGDIYAQLGLYVHEGIVEATSGDFIGQYLGETAQKARKFLWRNIERVIFLDEAYALTRRDEVTGRLDAYSEEAINTLIPFLSKNVGKLCFIAAGYEGKMKAEFMTSNAGMTRRFPISAKLPGYRPDILYKIFIRETALTYAGFKPPTKQLDELQTWEQGLATRIKELSGFFLPEARDLFIDVITAATRAGAQKYVPKLAELFSAQAGAMSNLAGVASALILSNGAEITKAYARRDDMFNILLTFVQDYFTGDDRPGKSNADVARSELLKVLKPNWVTGTDEIPTWTSFIGTSNPDGTDDAASGDEKGDPKDPCSRSKKLLESPNPFLDAGEITLKGDGFQCTPVDLKPMPGQVMPPAPAPKAKAKANAKKETGNPYMAATALQQMFDPKYFKTLFKYVGEDGSFKRRLEVPTQSQEPKKFPKVITFTIETNKSVLREELSKPDEAAIEKWMENNKIFLPQDTRLVMDRAQDLKYQVISRIRMEQDMHKLLEIVVKEMQAEALAREVQAGAEAANGSLEDDAASADTQPDTP